MTLIVRAFQALHDDYRGRPLAIDGDPGEQTEWAQGIEQLCPNRRNVVYRCQRLMRLGIVELNGDNRGPFINLANDLAGAPRGSAWCATSASWALRLDQSIASARKLGGHFPKTTDPLPGDLMWYPTGGKGSWTGHCGIVAAYNRTHVLVWEGNRKNAYRAVLRPKKGLSFSSTNPVGFEVDGRMQYSFGESRVPIPRKGLRVTYNSRQRKGTR